MNYEERKNLDVNFDIYLRGGGKLCLRDSEDKLHLFSNSRQFTRVEQFNTYHQEIFLEVFDKLVLAARIYRRAGIELSEVQQEYFVINKIEKSRDAFLLKKAALHELPKKFRL